ncbi:hypothetical protein F1C16_22315 (plasmid) [Hymenobacter sp. NBH84]|uniref:hypothetical protein n=1 Tax=Hymenobacter sp. NBH84 TaxID=2596915 RepID=UPI00162AAA77|nr:hypothetical protein [Hymenobacter sp. NBH84]QNE42358.1 hypothetical protein F1C16_22315 [Hymenobacter sp. NBH84]
MKSSILLVMLALLVGLRVGKAQPPPDYLVYHQRMIQAEELLAQHHYRAALAGFEQVLNAYDYVFLRDCQVTTQLALYVGDKHKAYHWLRRGVLGGWKLSDIRKHRFLKPLRTGPAWNAVQRDYATLRSSYEHTLQQPLRAEVLAMARRDQQLAFRNLLQLSKRAKERFLTQQFVPHSERRVTRIAQILQVYGYPGEKLIGNRTSMQRILSHHNSISTTYAQRDTLYPHLQPDLLQAVRRGELAPADYAVIEDWYVVIKSDGQQVSYGYLNPLTTKEVALSDARRQRIGLRSVALRNQLVEVQKETGMDLVLDGVFWVKGKLPIVAHR